MARKLAAHVQAAIRAGQGLEGQAKRLGQSGVPMEGRAQAPHTQAAVAPAQARDAGMPQAGWPAPAQVPSRELAPHVRRAVASAAQTTMQPGAREPAAHVRQAVAVLQPMKRKAVEQIGPTKTKHIRLQILDRPSSKVDIEEFDLEQESDEEELEKSAFNFASAFRDSSKFHKKVPAPLLTGKKSGKKNIKKKNVKRVVTEYMGEMAALIYMSNKFWKLGWSTGVLGGRGLDQVWYKGNLSTNSVTDICVVEAKGPGAKLSKLQIGKSEKDLSLNWIDDRMKILKKGTDKRKQKLAKLWLAKKVNRYKAVLESTEQGLAKGKIKKV